MKFVAGENGRSPETKTPRFHFVHHKTHMESTRRELGTPVVEGEHLTQGKTVSVGVTFVKEELPIHFV